VKRGLLLVWCGLAAMVVSRDPATRPESKSLKLNAGSASAPVVTSSWDAKETEFKSSGSTGSLGNGERMQAQAAWKNVAACVTHKIIRKQVYRGRRSRWRRMQGAAWIHAIIAGRLLHEYAMEGIQTLLLGRWFTHETHLKGYSP
jgi:hypothetical protein